MDDYRPDVIGDVRDEPDELLFWVELPSPATGTRQITRMAPRVVTGRRRAHRVGRAAADAAGLGRSRGRTGMTRTELGFAWRDWQALYRAASEACMREVPRIDADPAHRIAHEAMERLRGALHALPEAGAARVREVHNVWTVYGVNSDGSPSGRPLAEHRRPQDWGHPRWQYHRYRFELEAGGVRHVNIFHGWTDLQLEPHQYPELFASLVVQVLMPGSTPELCGRAYLEDEDFWEPGWGPQPPFYEPGDDAERAASQGGEG